MRKCWQTFLCGGMLLSSLQLRSLHSPEGCCIKNIFIHNLAILTSCGHSRLRNLYIGTFRQLRHFYPVAPTDQNDFRSCSLGCRAGLSFDPLVTPVALRGCCLLFDSISFMDREACEVWAETAVHTWCPGRHSFSGCFVLGCSNG